MPSRACLFPSKWPSCCCCCCCCCCFFFSLWCFRCNPIVPSDQVLDDAADVFKCNPITEFHLIKSIRLVRKRSAMKVFFFIFFYAYLRNCARTRQLSSFVRRAKKKKQPNKQQQQKRIEIGFPSVPCLAADYWIERKKNGSN